MFHGLGGQGVDGGEGLVQETYFPVYVLHLSATLLTDPSIPYQKGMTYLRHFMFRCTLHHPAELDKMECFDKGLFNEKPKMELLVDRLSPRTITLPAVPNSRLQEISAREGCSVQTGG